MAEPEPPEDQGNRAIENAVMLGFFVVLVAAGVWLLGTMADVRKAQDCATGVAATAIPSKSRIVALGTVSLIKEKLERCRGFVITTLALLALMGGPAMAQTGSNTGSSGAASQSRHRSAPIAPSAARSGNVFPREEITGLSGQSPQQGERLARQKDQEHLPRLLARRHLCARRAPLRSGWRRRTAC